MILLIMLFDGMERTSCDEIKGMYILTIHKIISETDTINLNTIY